MPRSNMFTKEQVLDAALQLTRKKGISAVSARSLGSELGSTSRPIFSHFENMQDVQTAIIDKANKLYLAYINSEISSGKYPAYKASGMAYVRFAKEEKELFKLLFMRERTHEETLKDPEEMDKLLSLICDQIGIDMDAARLFYLEMWTFTHGIATMIATNYYEWNEELVSIALSDMYSGLKWKYSKKQSA